MRKLVTFIVVVIAVIAVYTMPVQAQERSGSVTWSGDVDDTVVVYVHGDNVTDRTVHGKSTENINVDFEGRLPRRPVGVFIANWSGRGTVRVVRQPDFNNDFTATILIRDPEPGRDHYTFTLNWRRPDGDGPVGRF